MHGIEEDLKGEASVLRMDLFSPDGSEFFSKHNLRSVPGIVVLDAGGTVRYTSSGRLPDPDSIKQAVRAAGVAK